MAMPSTWIIVLGLLQIRTALPSPSGSALKDAKDVDYEGEVCRIRASFKSPFVRAFKDESTLEPGCNQSGKVKLAHEVHVIYVQVPGSGGRSGGRSHRPPQVNLDIVSNNERAVRNTKLVFILTSNQSVTWNITGASDVLLKAKHSTFWVSSNSRLLPSAVLNVQTKHFAVKKDFEQLEQWVKRKFHKITKAETVVLRRKITTYVGLDCRCCAGQNREETLLETKACVVPTNQGFDEKLVHIIELEGHDKNPSEITLNVHAASDAPLRRHLLLVLKSHHSTKWIVRTTKVRGILDIVTDQTVDTNGIDMQSVRVVNERLSHLSDFRLISWTATNYGAPLSYTSAKLANRFDLTVDGVSKTWQGHENNEDGILRNSDELIQNVLDRVKTLVEQHRTVSCLSGSLEVVIPKTAFLNYYQFKSDQLSLVDRGCTAQQNSTHFFWRTGLEGCGSIRRHDGNEIVVENAVVIRLLQPSGDKTLIEFSGSGMDPSFETDSLSETFSDDEDVARSRATDVRVDFRCRYVVDSELPTDVEYRLQIYKDSSFQHEVISFPFVMGRKFPLYVTTGLRSGHSLFSVIQNCSVIAVDNPGFHRHPLIVNRCVVDEMVSWIDVSSVDDDVSGERFTFHVSNRWGDQIKLSCDLTVCKRDSDHVADVPQCRKDSRQCSASDEDQQTSLRNLHTASRTVTIGPLVFHSAANNSSSGRASQAETGTKDLERLQVMNLGKENPCNEVVRIEGLDSPTVVAIAFAAFLIGALLSGTLWYIHSRTGPTKRRSMRRRSAETSGESTPSSTAPITVCHAVNQI